MERLCFVFYKNLCDDFVYCRHQDKLHDAWEKVLLNQFHDVIPGTSIGLVYCDADRLYKEAMASTEEVQRACHPFLFEGEVMLSKVKRFAF